MKIFTIHDLRLNRANNIFFGNAKFHGDYKYDVDSQSRVLTVFCKDSQGRNGRQVKYEFDETGKIGDKLWLQDDGTYKTFRKFKQLTD
jgi:hypothetical protein